MLDVGDPGGTLMLTDYLGRPRQIDGDFDGILGNDTRLDMGACEGGDMTLLMIGSGDTINWDPSINGLAVFNLYRSVLSVFLSSCATACVYTQDPAVVTGAARQCDLPSPTFVDSDAPLLGEAFIYWATGEDVIEGPVGFAASGAVLPNDNACP